MILLYLFFSIILMGCSMDRFEAIEIENVPVYAYTKLTLEDLGPFTPAVSVDEDISTWPYTSLSREAEMLNDTYTIIQELSDLLMQDKTNYTYKPFAFSPQGVVSSFHFLVTDKTVSLNNILIPSTSTESTIEHVNLIFQSKGSPFKQMLDSMVFEKDFFDSVLVNDGTLRISGKMRTSTDVGLLRLDKNKIVSVVSLFGYLKISKSKANKKTPTGFISGNLQLSIASNLVYEETPFQKIQYYSPVVLQVEVIPFSNVSMLALERAITNEYDAAENEQRDPRYWSVIKPIIWGSASGDLFTITRVIGNHDATANLKTDIWTNEEAFNLIFALFF